MRSNVGSWETLSVRFGSGPAVPSRRDLRGLRPHRARHWTVDAVSSNAGQQAPAHKASPYGGSRCPGCSQSLTLPPGALGSAACQGFLAVRLKPAPLLGFMGITASAGTASFAWLSVHRELAHKVSLCFSTPRRCWVLGVCRPYSGRSSPQAAHKPSPSAETRAITEIQRCRQLAPLRALKKM